MAFRVQTVMLGPDTEQYAGEGQGTADIAGIAAASRRTEELGYDGVTAPEAGHDPFLPLVVAAEHTEQIKLGTNVAIAFPRSPMVTAQVAWDLQQLSKGRFQLGLGTQVKGHVVRRYASTWTGPPGPRLRDYVLCVKAMFETFQKGEKPGFEGEHYQFTLMNPFFNPGPIEYPHPEIHLAAVNPYMARLAGELCDGLRLHPIATFRYTQEVVVPSLQKGAELSGRKLEDLDMIGAPFLAIAKDEEGIEAAKQALRQHIAFYASTRTYHAVLEFHGWLDAGNALHQMSREGRWKEMPGQITDEMLEEWAVIGTCDELAAKLKERCSGIFSTLLLDLAPELRRDEDWIAEIVDSLHRD
ncbi:MAG: TIGR03617 family F420-dependent LLM class oxidoreductase [Myxococcota bacterium]|jgi:probable F420-dependent oxidoreductase|nr:LLM class F420-dependent oxidoreductase [Deltaproteobacteria bacterium]MCP4244764.1 TIGR03617 family F420-dependent LLM class oxidoreductase [bacterium]MDP6074249.1 TIGR03617 family F420-dependent LLM class oxidoreductase [Myxococcota bacterium]MDP6244023.1 TIGR03617 family F420-dependent LLM class oxidoreductase [Myxococcota bacterium]MDP7075845.1 TIGR03617 family F420-dependent LLM class oxidoreductase [Myxococcota bacterium]